MRAERGNPVEVRADVLSGKPTARRAQLLGGHRMTEKRNAGGRKATGNRDMMTTSSRWSSRITGRIPGLVPGRESALTRSGEPVRRKMTEAPEPEDKLDAATTVVANGPEDAPFDWHAIDWRRIEDDVRRLSLKSPIRWEGDPVLRVLAGDWSVTARVGGGVGRGWRCWGRERRGSGRRRCVAAGFGQECAGRVAARSAGVCGEDPGGFRYARGARESRRGWW